MRTALLLAPLVLIACEAASNDGSEMPDVPAGKRTPVLPGGQPTGDGPTTLPATPPPEPKPITLDGKTAASTRIVVVDANGKRTVVTSGADGKFQIPNVMTPYDIAAPDLEKPRGWLGATRPDPTITTGRSRQVSFAVTIHTPGCPTASCEATVVTSSAHGKGLSTVSHNEESVYNTTVVHTLKDFDGDEPIDVDTIARSETYALYYHAHNSTSSASTSSIDTFPTQAPEIGFATFDVKNLASDQTPTSCSVNLAFHRHALYELTKPGTSAASCTARVPNIPGAELAGDTYRTQFQDHAKASGGGRVFAPITTSKLEIEGTNEYVPASPMPNDTVAPSASTVTWTKTHPGWSVVSFTIAGGMSLSSQTVVTSETKLDRARVEKLGLRWYTELTPFATTGFSVHGTVPSDDGLADGAPSDATAPFQLVSFAIAR